jgi:hypothetical protein
MAGPANDPPDAKMMELVSSEKTTLALSRESSSVSNDDGPKSNGPLITVLSHEEYSARSSRESVLRRLSEALMRHSLAEVRSSKASISSNYKVGAFGGIGCLVTTMAARWCLSSNV